MDKEHALSWLQQAWANCKGCRLCEERNSVVFGYGNPDAPIMIIGEAPGQQEDEIGLPFVGVAGQLLDQYLARVSCKDDVQEAVEAVAQQRRYDDKLEKIQQLRQMLLEDVYLTNVVMCRPPDNRDPSSKEIEACRPRLLSQIYAIDPILIIATGRIATEALVGKKVAITQTRGEMFDIEVPGNNGTIPYPLLAVLHPSFLLRKNDFKQRGGDGVKTYNDFVRAMNILDAYNLRHFDEPIPKNRPQSEK